MKNKIKCVSLAVASFMLLFVTTTMAAQTQEQTSVTQQQSVVKVKGKVNKSNVKKGDTFKYSITITNTGLEKLVYSDGAKPKTTFSDSKEIYKVLLVWQSSGKQSMECSYTGKYNKKTREFKLTDTIKIPKGMKQGKWKLNKIALYAAEEFYTEEDNECAVETIYNNHIKSNAILFKTGSRGDDLSFADFTVRGTGKKLDESGPTISPKSLKLSKKTMKENQKSKFSVKVTDQSKIKSVVCNWEFWRGESFVAYESYTMKYNEKKKVYECNVDFDGGKCDKIMLHAIYLTDIYGNYREYSNDSDIGFKKIRGYNQNFRGKGKRYKMGAQYMKAFKRMVVKKKK